jgi:DNA repair exonuclease SbcCD ATPase subunit
VSRNLNLLDANFVIRPCRDALSYEFLRSDDADDAWLDITRLSGGQKVKLSTAFLISVQETICKDVNFLVLDEPSTHLDEPSVNALGALFTSLATRMDNGNGQIWIVDHHFSLRSACSANFQLGSNDNETE